MDWENINRLRADDEIKFVICDRTDYEWAKERISEHDLGTLVKAVLMSPAHEQAGDEEVAGVAGLEIRDLAAWILDDVLDVVLQPQLHKMIWDPHLRGV